MENRKAQKGQGSGSGPSVTQKWLAIALQCVVMASDSSTTCCHIVPLNIRATGQLENVDWSNFNWWLAVHRTEFCFLKSLDSYLIRNGLLILLFFIIKSYWVGQYVGATHGNCCIHYDLESLSCNYQTQLPPLTCYIFLTPSSKFFRKQNAKFKYRMPICTDFHNLFTAGNLCFQSRICFLSLHFLKTWLMNSPDCSSSQS